VRPGAYLSEIEHTVTVTEAAVPLGNGVFGRVTVCGVHHRGQLHHHATVVSVAFRVCRLDRGMRCE
jgi:hypothetical protein